MALYGYPMSGLERRVLKWCGGNEVCLCGKKWEPKNPTTFFGEEAVFGSQPGLIGGLETHQSY